RICYCVKNTRTNVFETWPDVNVRLFSTSDCTGNFQAMGEGYDTVGNAQWVNSVSVGEAGISSSGPDGCPKYY
ncbi:hypothetical protein BGZ89_010576, partial [Linnemannia elongata]